MTDQGHMQPEVIRFLILEPCCLEILLIVLVLTKTTCLTDLCFRACYDLCSRCCSYCCNRQPSRYKFQEATAPCLCCFLLTHEHLLVVL
jgi:hypothetical protein